MPWLTPLAAVGISVVMLLAAAFHAKRSEHQAIAFNVVLLEVAVFVAYGRWFVHPLSVPRRAGIAIANEILSAIAQATKRIRLTRLVSWAVAESGRRDCLRPI